MMNEKEKELIENVALNYGYEVEEVQLMFEKIKTTLVNIWEEIKEIVNNVAEFVERNKNFKKYYYNWQMPKNITMRHQVLDRTPLQANIRNHI